MRLRVQIVALFALGVITKISAQDNEIPFYEKQARKDAQHEQLSVFSLWRMRRIFGRIKQAMKMIWRPKIMRLTIFI